MNSFEFRNVSAALPALMHSVLEYGDEVGSRNGRTKELAFTHITLTHPQERYVITPHRKASLPAQIAESAWILAGRNDIEWLSHYLPRAADFSDDGKTWRGGYGPRLRAWEAPSVRPPIDQLAHIVELLKKDPLTRRAVMAIYDPVTDVDPGKDIPCNDFIQFMSRLGELDMHVFIRSNDLMWGWSGINHFEWSVLQEIVAGLLGIGVGQLHFSISSLHLYEPHWNKASKIAEAGYVDVEEESYVAFNPRFIENLEELDSLVSVWFDLEEIIRTKGAREAQDEIDAFPEPMLRSWLNVLTYHWSGEDMHLDHLPSAMRHAALESPKTKIAEALSLYGQGLEPTSMSLFVKYVDELHREKDKAYKGSWKKRGEMLGIMANIARKIDRLGYTGAGDTATDTAVDLMVYLIKYRLWLAEQSGEGLSGLPVTPNSDDLSHFTAYLMRVSQQKKLQLNKTSPNGLEQELTELFEVLEHQVEEKRVSRYEIVDSMIDTAYLLASHLWWKDNNATRAFEYPS